MSFKKKAFTVYTLARRFGAKMNNFQDQNYYRDVNILKNIEGGTRV